MPLFHTNRKTASTSIALDYRVIAALHATGFSWDLAAIVRAMEVLAELKPHYLDTSLP